MPLAETVLLVAGAMLAGFVQGLSGFAFGMVAMSVWVWGVNPQLAAVMTVFGGLTGQLFSAASVRRGLQWPVLWPFLAGGLLGVPLGVALLPRLDATLFKFILGSLLVLCCGGMLLAAHLPRVTRGGRIGDGLAGLAGGVMGGIGGFTGVVPSLWCTLRGWDKDKARGVIQNFNLAALSLTFTAFLASGLVKTSMLPQFALVAPALILPSMLGQRVYVGLSENSFRRVVLGLLVASGVAMMAASLPMMLKAS
jgi:uncharacterized protein